MYLLANMQRVSQDLSTSLSRFNLKSHRLAMDQKVGTNYLSGGCCFMFSGLHLTSIQFLVEDHEGCPTRNDGFWHLLATQVSSSDEGPVDCSFGAGNTCFLVFVLTYFCPSSTLFPVYSESLLPPCATCRPN